MKDHLEKKMEFTDMVSNALIHMSNGGRIALFSVPFLRKHTDLLIFEVLEALELLVQDKSIAFVDVKDDFDIYGALLNDPCSLYHRIFLECKG